MLVDHRITGERARGLYHEHGIVEPRRRRPRAERVHDGLPQYPGLWE